MLADREEEARLSEAAKVSMETQQMTPLIKEELRLSIMKKRHASGQDEIKVEFSEPVHYELTPHEQMKRERRREQNRRAAQRCRQKKKLQQSGKQEVFSTIITQNNQLHAEVLKLRKEKKDLGTRLEKHLLSGCCRQTKLTDLQLVQPAVEPTPDFPIQNGYPALLPGAQPLPMTTGCSADGTLPSFADAFLENVSPSVVDQDIFTFVPDMRTESDRTWSGTSDDIIAPDSLPEMIFEAIDSSDDVFYDNDQFPVKMSPDTMRSTPLNSLELMDENWGPLEYANVFCREPNFDRSLPNEP